MKNKIIIKRKLVLKKIVFIILFILFCIHLSSRIYSYRNEYLTPYNSKYWENLYLHSQWVIPNSKNPIGDDAVYTYAGWEYIHGKDPTLLNAEIPPLGKYLIGISEVVFNNQNIFSLTSGIFFLFAMFCLSTVIFKDKLLSFVPVFFFSLEPLFWTQLRAPLFDLLHGGLLFITFYFFLKEKYIISAIFLGLMAATKASSSTFALVIVSSLLYLIITKRYSLIKTYLFSLLLSALVFLLTYSRYFLLGHSLIDFLKVQKWVLVFYASGAKGSWEILWSVLFSGTWKTWWGTHAVVKEWHIGWAFLTITSGLVISYLIRKRMRDTIVLISIWCGLYIIFLSVVPLWSRYLLLLLPYFYIITLYGIIYVAGFSSHFVASPKAVHK